MVEELVLYHHKPSKSSFEELTKIIQKADHHSSFERKDLEKGKESDNVNREPLISIFSRVNLHDNKFDTFYLPLKKLSLLEDYKNDFNDYYKKILPVETKNITMDYKTLWNEFNNEIIRLTSFNNGNIIKPNFDTLFNLLKKYSSRIPSAAYKSEADISLFDHSKTTAALATCRYIYSRDKTSDEKLYQTNHQKVYLAINGDISGIQKFIYKVSSPQEAQSGMSKRLRGRSLYLNLLNDAIASELVKKLGLNISNILFVGGGRFIIIAPNTKNIIEKIENIKNEINRSFIRDFNGELYLSLVHEECSGNDLEGFGNITKKLNNKLIEDKKHKFINHLDELFKIEETVDHYKTCPVCGEPISSEKGVCEQCKSHEKLGFKVANAKFMIKSFINNDSNINDIKIKFDFSQRNIGYAFKSFKETIDFINNLDEKFDYLDFVEIIKLNDTDFLDDEIIKAVKLLKPDYYKKISFGFNFLGNTVPRHPLTTLYFEHLAKISKGANKLGIVKMDVDNLGKIFTSGFKHLEEDKDKNGNILRDEEGNHYTVKGATISRISTLSSQLDMFFSGFINKIAENYRVFDEVCENCKGKVDKIELKLQKDINYEESAIISNDYGKEDVLCIYREKTEHVCPKCEKNAIPTIHINYSGGDDLLVFGPYDDIMDFSKEFREKFMEWTCNNPSITLSAGINIVDAKFPIGKAAIKADEFLESSKNCGEDKDKVNLFNEVVKWEENGKSRGYYDLLEFGKYLEKKVNDEDIGRGMLYAFLRLWQGTFKNYDEILNNSQKWEEDNIIRMQKKKYIPQFKYKLRLIKKDNIREEIDKKGIKFMPWIKIPVSWASLRTR